MPKILIAPLDWGLGHATRCIPLIHCLKAEGWDITLAADGLCAQLLHKTFPELPLHQLPGYRIGYGTKNLPFQIIKQLPSLYYRVKAENQWLKKQMLEHKWDVILSDNRPGLYHKEAYNIYLTHQLQIHSGLGEIANKIAGKLHRHFMKRFDELWVPDIEKPHRLAGKLSVHKFKNKQVSYIGLLSRMEAIATVQMKYDFMILLSGPEPQRTILENKLLNQISDESGKVILVRGTNQLLHNTNLPLNIEVIDLADSQTINQKIQESAYVICRSGYTTLMDLMKLKKKALLIPTPGQGEQEYLSDYAQQQQYFPSTQQSIINIHTARKIIQNFVFEFPFVEESFLLYQKKINELTNKFM